MNLGMGSQVAPFATVTVDGVPTTVATYASESGKFVVEMVKEGGAIVCFPNTTIPRLRRRDGAVVISFPDDSPFYRDGERVREHHAQEVL